MPKNLSKQLNIQLIDEDYSMIIIFKFLNIIHTPFDQIQLIFWIKNLNISSQRSMGQHQFNNVL